MLLPRLGALLLAASYANALPNTSPFFLLSSDPLPSDAPLRSSQFANDQAIEDQLIELLSSCDKNWYTIIEQDGVAPSDVQAMAKLSSKIRAADQGKVVEIPHAVADGGLDSSRIMEGLAKACRTKGRRMNDGSGSEAEGNIYDVLISHTVLPSKAEARKEFLSRTDDELAKNIANILGGKESAMLIYISRPATASNQLVDETGVYEMDEPYPEAPHIDLKRDTGLHRRQDSDDDMQAGLPLFEKYQFLSPPLFMGLSVSILLLMILSVGVRAISGLEVSYMAFNKEMGPQAQRAKQQ